jgi:hypothetical protein
VPEAIACLATVDFPREILGAPCTELCAVLLHVFLVSYHRRVFHVLCDLAYKPISTSFDRLSASGSCPATFHQRISHSTRRNDDAEYILIEGAVNLLRKVALPGPLVLDFGGGAGNPLRCVTYSLWLDVPKGYLLPRVAEQSSATAKML